MELASLGEWRRVLDVNLNGQYYVAREVGRRMLEAGGGRMAMMAAQAAIIRLEGQAAYSASKAGILGMFRRKALEWGGRSIPPTVVETEMAAIHRGGEKGRKARAEIPVGRFATPPR